MTRLRSDKGAFVQSPLGAFDSEAPAPPAPEFVRVFCRFLQANRAWNIPPSQSPCSFGATNAAGGGSLLIFECREFNATLAQWEPASYARFLADIDGVTWEGVDTGEQHTFGAGTIYCDTPGTVRVYIPSTQSDRSEFRTNGTYGSDYRVCQLAEPVPQLFDLDELCLPLGSTNSVAGTVQVFDASPGFSRYWFSACNTADTSAGDTGYVRLGISLDSSVAIADVMRSTISGTASGVVYQPAVEGMAFICTTGNDLWGSTDFVPVSGGRVYKEYAETTGGTSPNTSFVYFYFNYGEHPGSAIPQFQQGERVSLHWD